MTSRIGIELSARSIRAVRLEGWAGKGGSVVEAEWDPEGPEAAVRTLRDTLGRGHRVAIAVRLPLLFTKRVRLPPISSPARRDVLRLEPQRYFPIRLDDLAVAIRDDDDLVFAAREASVSQWVRALEALGPVDLVEPGPLALARALAEAGIDAATVVLDDGSQGLGVLRLCGGRLAEVRRLYGGVRENRDAFAHAEDGGGGRILLSPWSDERAGEIAAVLEGMARVEPVPDLGAVPAPFLSAYGAARGAGTDLDATLAPDDLRTSIVARRRRDLVLAAVAAVAALAFSAGSLDAWRGRQVQYVAAGVRDLQARAAPILAVRGELADLNRRTQSVAAVVAERPDPLRALVVLSRRLPASAYLRSLRFSAGEWQVEGYARQAAEVTQALGSAPELGEVRVLAATNRAQTQGEVNESFALAFRLVQRP